MEMLTCGDIYGRTVCINECSNHWFFTHNECIECLWQDVYRCVLYQDCFRKLEEEGCLDSLNETDLYCLHFIFIPKINTTLENFVESWNNHSLSSENNPIAIHQRGHTTESDTIPPSSSPSGSSNEPLNCYPLPIMLPFHIYISFAPCPLLYRKSQNGCTVC